MNNILRIDDIFKDNFPIRLYKVSEGWPKQEHAHEYMQIWYVVQGSCTHIVDNVKYQLTSKNLLVIPPYISHDIKNETDDIIIIGCEFPVEVVTEDNIIKQVHGEKILDFTYTEIFETVIQRIKPCYIPSLQCQIKIEHLLDNMLNELDRKEKFYEVCLKSDLLEFLTIIARDYEVNANNKKIVSSYKSYIQTSLAYIEQNFHSKLYIEDVAKTAAMSESYFSFFFKDVTGQTFTEYVSMLRIEKAKELLKDTSLSIAEVGTEVGFKDNAYFNKVFKKVVNFTPATYRKINLENNTKILEKN